MDIQQLLATASNQTSTAKPTPGSGQPGIFAHHMALAGLRPDAAEDAAKNFTALWREPWGPGADSELTQLTASLTEVAQQSADIDDLASKINELLQHLPAEVREELSAQLEDLFAQLPEGLLPEQGAQLLAELTTQLTTQLPDTERAAMLDALMQDLPAAQRDTLLAQLTAQLSPEASEQLFAQLTTQLPAAERAAMLDALMQDLPAAQRDTLLAQLTAQLPPEASEQLFAQLTTQLPAAERAAMLDALIQDLPAAQRDTLLAQLTAQLSPEASEQLFAQLTAQIPAAERGALLTELSRRITPEARAAVLVDWSQRLLSPERLELIREAANLAAPTAQARKTALANGAVFAAQPGAEQAARAALSEPNSMRDRLRTDERPGLASLTSDRRATISTEALRALAENSATAQTARETLAPSLRELLGLNFVNREGFIPQQARNTAGTDASVSGLGVVGNGLASYGAIAGSQGGTASAALGMSAPLNSAAWPQQLGQQLLVLSQRGGDQQVELRLNPPDLGPLTVSLKIGEQGTQIQFLAANALVRSAVEQAIPQLREALAEQGINLGETSVGEQRQEDEQGFAGDGAQRQGLATEILQGAEETELSGSPTRIDVSLDGRVDIYA